MLEQIFALGRRLKAFCEAFGIVNLDEILYANNMNNLRISKADPVKSLKDG